LVKGQSGFATLGPSLYVRNMLLCDIDWSSMAHSLEIRLPPVDATLLRALAPISSKLRTNSAKRRLAASATTSPAGAVLNRAKTGLFKPAQTWLKQGERLYQWRRVPSFTVVRCPRARRWDYQEARG
jgi:asparagine synthase (glutamine-hydrolysing)